jgi:zinc D-Ala-D-Ala carboxypeptidase
MQLSKNLSLLEMTNSQTAKRLGISNQPTEAHLTSMKVLAENIFQPIRKHFAKPIWISSGYRTMTLGSKFC